MKFNGQLKKLKNLTNYHFKYKNMQDIIKIERSQLASFLVNVKDYIKFNNSHDAIMLINKINDIEKVIIEQDENKLTKSKFKQLNLEL